MISPLNVLDFTNTHNGTCRVIWGYMNTLRTKVLIKDKTWNFLVFTKEHLPNLLGEGLCLLGIRLVMEIIRPCNIKKVILFWILITFKQNDPFPRGFCIIIQNFYTFIWMKGARFANIIAVWNWWYKSIYMLFFSQYFLENMFYWNDAIDIWNYYM